MNKVAERFTRILGSTPVVIIFFSWLVIHNLLNWVYVNFISDVAILLTLLILRAQNVQSDRMERHIKADLGKSEEQLKLLKAIKEEQAEIIWHS